MSEHTLGMELVGWIAWGTGLVGVGVLTWGVLIGLIELVRLENHRIRGREIAHERAVVRQDLGYYILLGLEFLIAADIMHTIRNPTLEELTILGVIVLIRTVISHFVTEEMKQSGRLQHGRGSEDDGDAGGDRATD
ncbi:MAG: DUF1622 domain-containing protein [Armatimonadota bacterium]